MYVYVSRLKILKKSIAKTNTSNNDKENEDLYKIILAGLLTHMEHMRMDPKHQFAAQYVLSRAAAERRERETLLAAVSAASAASSSGLLSLTGMGQGRY